MKEKNPNHSCRPGEALSPFLCPEKYPYFTIVTPNHFYLIMINAPTFQNVLSLFSTTSTCIEWGVSTIISSSNNSFDTKSLIWDSDHVHWKVLWTPPHPETIPPNPIPPIDSTEGDGVFIPIIIGVNDKEYLRPGWNKSASSDQGFSCPVVFSQVAFTWRRWKWLFNILRRKEKQLPPVWKAVKQTAVNDSDQKQKTNKHLKRQKLIWWIITITCLKTSELRSTYTTKAT